MSMMGGHDLNINVDANVTGYERQIDAAQRSTARWESQLGQLEADLLALEKSIDDHANAALQRQHDAMDKTGKAMFAFGAIGAAAFGLSANEAVKWESAWAGVTKTVDGTEAQMEDLEDDLRSMTAVLPSSHEEIAAVAEAAGQLGVQRENIAAFTRTMIDLGETTNLEAEEAATAIAQMMNVMESAPEVVDRIGATLVELGNNGASTEAQILSMAQRVSGAGALIGASEADVLALSSAMANLGIESELGGGAMQRVLLNVYQAVEGGGEKLAAFARVSGLSAEEFATQWENDPIRAFDAFLQGLGRSQGAGENVIKILDELGIKGTQNLQVMLRLAGAGDTLTTALDDSARAWEDNSALVEEARKRYATTEAQVAMARNQLRDSAIDVGNFLLPAIAKVVDVGGDMLQFWSDLPGPVKTVVSVLALATTGMALFGGAALIAIPKIAAFKAAVDGLEAGALKTAGTRLGALGSFLAGPWGMLLGAGITALGFFAAAQGDATRKVDELTESLDQQTGAVTAATQELVTKELIDSGMLDRAEQLGINLGLVTDAALGSAEAMDELKRIQAEIAADDPYGAAGAALGTSGQKDSINELVSALEDESAALSQARRELRQNNEAQSESKLLNEETAESQEGLTGAWADGADAASALGEEVKTLGEALEELAEPYLNQRQAQRAVRDSLREVNEAVDEYVKENGKIPDQLRKGSKAADEFGAMLDELAEGFIAELDAAEKAGAGQQRLRQMHERSREKLIEVADQLGMTREQAEKYADQLLGVPEYVETHFEQTGVERAIADLQRYRETLANLPYNLAQQFHGAGEGEHSLANEAAGNRPRLRDPYVAAGNRLRVAPQRYAAGPATAGPMELSDAAVDRLAQRLGSLRPLYGDVHVSDGYGGFKEQMLHDKQRQGLGGF